MPENYLDSDADRDRLTAENVRSITDRALTTIATTKLSTGVWPYELVAGEPFGSPGRFSMSTQAMILHALAISHGLINRSSLVPALEGRSTGEQGQQAEIQAIEEGLRPVLHELEVPSRSARSREGRDVENDDTPGEQSVAEPVTGPLTESSTWGDDDPLTLSWLFELLDPENAFIAGDLIELAARVRTRIAEAATRLVATSLEYPPGPLLSVAPKVRTQSPHPFILLRVVQLALRLGESHPAAQMARKGTIESLFRNALNAELANSSVRDGGFDPAALVFSLEGLVLLNVDSVPDALLDRTLAVLGSSQAAGAHWRPVHPITSTPQGLVLLPQSIEVANSFLRICSHWENAKRGPLFSDSLAMIRQYAEWVTSSSVTITAPTGESYTGWQSEHTYAPGTIHLWETSQVVLFLEHYAAMLETHIAKASREAANLDFKTAKAGDATSRLEQWAKKCEHEPLSGLPEHHSFRVYDRVSQLLLEPARTGSGRPIYSMLLYGPPGTGKTDFSRALADALGYDFITVSPSDFTRSGEAGVEARAQDLFNVLSKQARCVILFDEIDRLLLDRDSAAYGEQGDMFQFMTPSMLTKINDLRRLERCVFIIATNYADRIDGAIKRPGRIDEQLLLLPPDLAQRRRIIRAVSAEAAGESWAESQVDEFAKNTPLYVFKELETAIYESVRILQAGSDFSSVIAKIQEERPTISLGAYRLRFEDKEGDLHIEQGPWREACMLAYLRAEAGAPAPDDWMRRVISAKIGTFDGGVREVLLPLKADD